VEDNLEVAEWEGRVEIEEVIEGVGAVEAEGANVAKFEVSVSPSVVRCGPRRKG
jgi:hypothetical protein